ncbi:MAG: zinc ribbon domain-containing protein [Sarcina sp.]
MGNCKYCYKCGTSLSVDAKTCHSCGTEARPIPKDEVGILAGLCACGNWIVGLVLFLMWKDSKPKSAKKICAISAISTILLFVLSFAFGAMSGF